jgi:hypothetical protein
MKRFWLVLLSLGLVMAFSTSALAVDVKFSGEIFVGSMYLDKTSLAKDIGPNTAFYFQRLRLFTEFVVSPGLSAFTRADIMERVWGAARSVPNTSVAFQNSAATTAENENIAFDYAYLQYASPIGILAAGYMTNGAWATAFGNSEAPIAKISYILPLGAYTIIAQVGKSVDLSITAKNPLAASGANGFSQADVDIYYLMQIYAWKTGQAGLGLFYVINNANKVNPALGDSAQYLLVEPYAVFKIGPVQITTELDYIFGKTYNGFNQKVDISSWNGWVDALVTLGPVYFGGTAAYVEGQNANTSPNSDTITGNTAIFTAGTDFNPCLIMFNWDRYYWAGTLTGQGAATAEFGPMFNAWFYQGRVGVKPTDKLDVMFSVSYANADKKPAGFGSDAYGWEVDVKGTYKITNNLSYMLGFGYLFTGDYYKGTTAASVQNDYILINKLTLTF